MINSLLLFLSTFAEVFCLGAQSLLVNNGCYLAAFGNSLLIGGCQFLLFKLAPEASGLEIAAFYLAALSGLSPLCLSFVICTGNRNDFNASP